MAEQFVRLTLTREQAAEICAVVRNGYDAVTFEGTINGQPIPVRIGTDEDDQAELARPEDEFAASGDRGVGLAERIDTLRARVRDDQGGSVEGFYVEIAGDYGVTEGSIHLHGRADGSDEIVMWDSAEWVEDPSLVYVIVNAIEVGHRDGPDAIRAPIEKDERGCQHDGD